MRAECFGRRHDTPRSIGQNARTQSKPPSTFSCTYKRLFSQLLCFDKDTNACGAFSASPPRVLSVRTGIAATPFLSCVSFTLLCIPRGWVGYPPLFLASLDPSVIRVLCSVFREKMRGAAGAGLEAADWARVTGHESRDTDHRTRDTGHGSRARITGNRTRDHEALLHCVPNSVYT